MTHSTHDLEILASHAAGYEPDQSAATALLATCEECRLVFDEQVRMRSVVSRAGMAKLSEAEQAQLLSAVLASLPKESLTHLASREAKPAIKPLSPVWGRVLAAAATLAVVVGVGAVLPNRGNQSATTLATAEAAAPEFASEGANDERAATTTAAGATLYGLTASDGLDKLKAEAQALGEESAPADTGTANADAQCPTETEDLAIRERGESTYQGRPVILILAESNDELTPHAFYADDCVEIPLP